MTKRSKGSLLLLRLSQTQEEIAKAVGVHRRMVDYWTKGEKRPSAPAREVLAAAPYNIPAGAWDEEAASGSSPQLPAGSTSSTRRDGEGHLEFSLRSAREELEEILKDQTATQREKRDARKHLFALAKEYRQLTGAHERGPGIYKLPIWLLTEETVARVLKAHPDALRALADECRRVGLELELDPGRLEDQLVKGEQP